ncbi:MAG TPA: hypothetical protein P5284_10560 [Candidatus Contendobacter sp.]|nr:hypothetical protein [Candidatus Contendobacter sp.]
MSLQIPKLKVLVEAGAARDAEVTYAADAEGWMVAITYASRRGEQREVLERQRGGVRGFTTLDAVARALAGLGLPAFRVNAAGLAGEEAP